MPRNGSGIRENFAGARRRKPYGFRYTQTPERGAASLRPYVGRQGG